MVAEKEKGHNNAPDKRLAKAFNFTSEDLAANRLGFITSDQEFNTPLWQRRFFRQLGAMFNFKSGKQRLRVGKRCGRVEVNHKVRPLYDSMRRSITHMIDDYSLNIKDKRFKINVAQYHALNNRVFYIVYYDTSNNRIVALERVPNDC